MAVAACAAMSCYAAEPLSAATVASPKSTATASVSILTPPFLIPGLNRERTVRLYLPPGYATSTKRYPMLYMHDGQNLFDAATSYAGEWGVDETLDTLAKIQGLELIVVGIDQGGVNRMTEFNPWDAPRFGRGEGA